jgi:hypothetical protein
MVTKYPAAIDTVFTLKPILDGLPVTGGSVEQLREAIIAIEDELGVRPSGLYATVRGRLDSIENIVGNLQIIELDKDLGGTLEFPLVIGIRGRPVSTNTPLIGQVLVWDGLAWSPAVGPTTLPPPPVTTEVFFSCGVFTTNSNTFTRAGARTLDMTLWPPIVGISIRTVKFTADVDKTSGATSVEVRLYDVTHNITVAGTGLISTNNANTPLTATLTVGSSSGNLRNDVPTQYELQVRMNGGSADAVFLTSARLVITYA